MNCSKFLGILLCGISISSAAKALELQELWQVSLPDGQTYMHTGIAWSPVDSLPHVFMLGQTDRTVYHMTPGCDFEAMVTLPEYPISYSRCFGVCLDSTWETSRLVHFRYLSSDSMGRVLIVNLATGDSIHAIDFATRLAYEIPYEEERDSWWHPNTFLCGGARHGMIACLSGTYYDRHYWYDWFSTSGGYTNCSRVRGWSMRNFESLCEFSVYQPGSQACCLMGADSVLDLVYSGHTWGFWEVHDWNDDWSMWFDYWGARIYFCLEQQASYAMSEESQGTVMALERADGPAWGLLFCWNDSLKYWVRGPTEVWSIPSNIPSPELAAAFPHRILPQRVALVYSESGSLTEIDLAGGHILESVEFPLNVQALQPYLTTDSSWELMAVFDRYVRGYRVTGLLPADAISALKVPESYSLAAYPNPFNDAVKIIYELPRTVEVNLRIVDILGREVTTFTNDHQMAGKHEVKWNAANLSSGIYFVCLQAGAATRVQKLVHLK
jgi:hypothetical protein